MQPSILALLFHVGHVVKTLKDVEQGIAHLVSGKATPDDAKAVLSDIADLIDDGIIVIPGVSSADMKRIAQELRSGIGVAPSVAAQVSAIEKLAAATAAEISAPASSPASAQGVFA